VGTTLSLKTGISQTPAFPFAHSFTFPNDIQCRVENDFGDSCKLGRVVEKVFWRGIHVVGFLEVREGNTKACKDSMDLIPFRWAIFGFLCFYGLCDWAL